LGIIRFIHFSGYRSVPMQGCANLEHSTPYLLKAMHGCTQICLVATQKVQHRLDFNTRAISSTRIIRVNMKSNFEMQYLHFHYKIFQAFFTSFRFFFAKLTKRFITNLFDSGKLCTGVTRLQFPTVIRKRSTSPGEKSCLVIEL
jgi:hypothetical protein